MSDIEQKYNALIERLESEKERLIDMYAKDIHKHRMGVGDKCPQCEEMAKAKVEALIRG